MNPRTFKIAAHNSLKLIIAMKKKNAGFWHKEKEEAAATAASATAITNKLRMAQKSGALNLVGMSLSVLPAELTKFSELRLLESWWEAFPLLKLDCSNNQLVTLPADLATQAVQDDFRQKRRTCRQSWRRTTSCRPWRVGYSRSRL